MTLNVKVVRFAVNMRIRYDDPLSLEAAIKDIKKNLYYEAMCAGEHNFHTKMMKPRKAGKKHQPKTDPNDV